MPARLKSFKEKWLRTEPASNSKIRMRSPSSNANRKKKSKEIIGKIGKIGKEEFIRILGANNYINKVILLFLRVVITFIYYSAFEATVSF
mgnify:CR=1 FL=1